MTSYLPSVSIEKAPTHTPILSIRGKRVEVHISHYEPWLLGVNCSRVISGQCVSKMSSGKPWADYVDQGQGGAAACISSWPFGLQFKTADGRLWTCLDRGSAIVVASDGRPWVDLLTSSPGYRFGEVAELELVQ